MLVIATATVTVQIALVVKVAVVLGGSLVQRHPLRMSCSTVHRIYRPVTPGLRLLVELLPHLLVLPVPGYQLRMDVLEVTVVGSGSPAKLALMGQCLPGHRAVTPEQLLSVIHSCPG